VREYFRAIKRLEEALEEIERNGFEPQVVFLVKEGAAKLAIALEGTEELAEKLFHMAADKGRLKGLGTFEVREVEEDQSAFSEKRSFML
jgi:hypothetical protein